MSIISTQEHRVAKAICEAGYSAVIVQGNVWLALSFTPSTSNGDYCEVNGFNLGDSERVNQLMEASPSQVMSVINHIFTTTAYRIAFHPSIPWVWYRTSHK